MISVIGPALGFLGNVVSGFFGLQQAKVERIKESIEVLNQANISAGDREKAIASVIIAESNSGYWLAAAWRPLVMVGLSILVGMYFFGYTTPNLMAPMPQGSIISEIFEMLKIGLMGYMPLRTVEKIVQGVNVSSVINSYLAKLTKD